MRNLIIAIDGTAASGKSTTAKLVAERLSYLHIDTGAMYRALTLKLLKCGVNMNDEDTISCIVENTKIQLVKSNNETIVLLDNNDVTQEIRSKKVDQFVSIVSRVKKVREIMVQVQRKMAQGGGVVIEGRDIGSVVVPNADLKIFMTADIKERAKRRQLDLVELGSNVGLEDVECEIVYRDKIDSNRDISPLIKPDDAIELDTTNLTIDQQVDVIVNKAREILKCRNYKMS